MIPFSSIGQGAGPDPILPGLLVFTVTAFIVFVSWVLAVIYG